MHSRENSPQVTDLPLSHHDFDATWNGIQYFYQSKEKNELIKSFLTPNVEEIAMFYGSHSDKKERSDFIKSFFNSVPFETTLSNGVKAGFDAYADSIRLWRGDRETPEREAWEKWFQIENSVFGMILLEQWIEPQALLVSGVDNQLEFIGTKVNDDILPLPQNAIDYILGKGSSFSEGKMRVYRQFTESLSKEDNINFLINEYGLGGGGDAIPGSGYWESHSSKGIEICDNYSVPERRVLLKWNYVEKRISELIKLDRYLSPKEKEMYPQWLEGGLVKEVERAEEVKTEEVTDLPNRYNANIEVEKTMEQPVLTFVQPETKETKVLYNVLSSLKIDDIDLTYEGGILIAKNNDNTWSGTEVYAFLIDEAFVFQDDGSVLGIDDKLLDEFKELCKEKGVTFADNRYNPLYRNYLSEKAENSDKILFYQVGDFFEAYDEDAKIVAGALELVLTSRQISRNERAPMVGLPRHVLKTYLNMLTERGLDVSVCFLENGERKTVTLVSQNKEVPVDLATELDPTPQGFNVTPSPYLANTLPTITCVWSEHEAFDDGKTYSVRDFDELMKASDADWRKKRQEVLDKYGGSSELAFEADDPDCGYLGYAKTKFTVNMPDGTTFTERQDIGDGDGGVIDFLKQYPAYNAIIPILENALLSHRPSAVKVPESIKEPAEKEKPTALATPKPRQESVAFTDLHPEIPMADRHNFNLASHEIEEVGKKERFRRNMEAIRVLKECEFDNRFATPEEQIILSKYVGWGGIPEAFDENNEAWANEFTELYTALSPQEYESAKDSVLSAFYTPTEVVTAVYDIMERLGFQSGNILEPSCGVGNFIGMLPENMQNSKIFGVEIDSISAGIAQQLYQKTSIKAEPFEKADLKDNFFDAVIGNVPFGDFKVLDIRYDKHNFLIHDYFFAKSLDKVRAGGILVLLTSMGTMDKANPKVRKYIAQRAELLGAIRLPNNTFKGNAGTSAVSDIIILQKRDRLMDIEPEWVHLAKDGNGIQMNSYFADHPEMILGKMEMVSSQFGKSRATCTPFKGVSLKEQLNKAVQNINGEITNFTVLEEIEADSKTTIPADPSVKNFSYTLFDGDIYYRENSEMTLVEISNDKFERMKGLIEIRDCVRRLLDLQRDNYPDAEIKLEQSKLNNLYDSFTKEYGTINSRTNKSLFAEDSSLPLLLSLEKFDKDNIYTGKADIFTKRTIKPHIAVNSVDTANEALAVSIGEKACIDIPYMCSLTGKTEKEIFEALKGVIFLNPMYDENSGTNNKYVMADEYLSGNVRKKLAQAQKAAEISPNDFAVNVEALEKVQPKDLTASEISVQLGTTWIPPEIYEDFIHNLIQTPIYLQSDIKVNYSQYTGEWNVSNKSMDSYNINAKNIYGTERINAYKIIEDTLNLRDVHVYDYIQQPDGKVKAVLNENETQIAQEKQDGIKEKFKEWIWSDPVRRNELCKKYNEKYNCIRPREYDGSHIVFSGMNPEITLKQHQKNAVAHILYGGNTLLAHAVGAGKTFEMVAAAMESKRLGLCNKSMFVVPNHITEQWANEFMNLYPSANILVATEKDFETKNRKRFCGKIATGDYDAVIIGHSQFEKIPISIERQREMLQRQLNDIVAGMAATTDKFSVKQMARSKKSIQNKLEKLNSQTRKDDVVTFEQLGIDRLFVDESHYYKNLFLYTKMRNVAGISQTEAQKSSDLFMKCQYLDELTDNRGVVFATGTPVSNSMVELYTIQRYLQYDTLEKNNLHYFDSWASMFGETVTSIELKPEGTGYRAKKRFARFNNLPELMAMFKEIADIKTADMLNLDVPEAEYITVSTEPSEIQKSLVDELGERAEKIRKGIVKPQEDNMLKITNDGRKLALDQRLINPKFPDASESKVNSCVENIFNTWQETQNKKSTQLVFCDLSTPKSDEEFSVYTDVRDKLVSRGIPENEIEFIHNAKTKAQKATLFKKVCNGAVRVLLGSTPKMGAGTNVQDKLIALHDLDCPWRPSDLEQRAGRIIRQHNENPAVKLFRYVTKGTFDAYLYQLVENKQKFISQIFTSKSPARSCEDIDESVLSYAEIKMLATGNPLIKEKMDLDIQVQRLRLLKSNFMSAQYVLEDKITKYFPQLIAVLNESIPKLESDLETAKAHPKGTENSFVGMTVDGTFHKEKESAGSHILEMAKYIKPNEKLHIGSYRGFEMFIFLDGFSLKLSLVGKATHSTFLGESDIGNITRIDNLIDNIGERLSNTKNELDRVNGQLETAKEEIQKSFDKEQELQEKSARLNEINAILNTNSSERIVISDDAPDELEPINRGSKNHDTKTI
ncbi:MAG: LPD25 domain-containing protein [Candidatus Fimenecus sp.]